MQAAAIAAACEKYSIMKQLLFLLLFGATLAARAQTTDSAANMPQVALHEVRVHTTGKSQHQKLFSYFKTNEAATTEDILSRMPSLSLVRRGSFGQEPIIRSFSASQTTLLLDGMRIQGACTDRMDPATIYTEPMNLEGITVQTNGNTLLGASVGGTLNLKLAQAYCGCESPEFSGSFSSGYQSNAHAFYEALSLNYATAKFGIRATGSYRKSQDYRDGHNETVRFSGFEKFNYSLAGIASLGKDWLLKGHFIADDGWHIGYPALPMDVGYAYARIGSLGLMRHRHDAAWEHLELKVYANRIVHYMDDTRRPDVAMHMDMPGQSTTLGAFAEGRRRIGANQQLNLRADVSDTRLKASMTMYDEGQPPMFMLTWPDNRQLRGGLAVQYQWQPDSLTTLQASVRGDVHAFSLQTQQAKDQVSVINDGSEPIPYFIPTASLTATRRLFPRLAATWSASIGGRTPTASELYGFYLFSRFDGFDYLGQTNLKPEQSLQTELTLQWIQKKWQASGTAYISSVSHYLTGVYDPSLSVMTPGARGVKRYENLDNALLYGLEGSFIWQPFTNTSLVSTLKYNYGQDEAGHALPLIPPFRNVTSLTQRFGRFGFTAEFEGALAQNRVNEAAAERPTPGFAIAHLRASYAWTKDGTALRISGGVENIGNAWYYEHLDWGGIPRPGRNFYALLSVGF